MLLSDSEDSEVNLSEIKTQASSLYKKVSQKRFKRLPSGYQFDRWMFQLAMFLVFGWFIFVSISYNFNLDYYECIDPNPYFESGLMCKNPFYKPELEWKGQEFLPPGEYGQKPGPLFNSITYVPIILFLISGIANHYIHNRRGKR